MPEGRAARLEGNLIKALNPVFNIIGNNSFNMHGIARRYLDCHRYVMMNYYKQSGDFRRLDELYNYFEDWAMVDY